MENSNGKALVIGKNAEKRRSEALKRELLVLVHDFLNEEGLFEAADVMRDALEPLLTHFKVADNIDLPLIATEFLAYYRLRFNKEPTLVKKIEANDFVGKASSKQQPKRQVSDLFILSVITV